MKSRNEIDGQGEKLSGVGHERKKFIGSCLVEAEMGWQHIN